MDEAEMSVRPSVPFQLQFDKPVATQIKFAEWNPEKDLLAMVSRDDDFKLMLHRFNWQRLWTSSLGQSITSICWRPDGRVIVVGLEDGAISLHDVEDGKLLRRMKFHCVSVVSLNWVDNRRKPAERNHNSSSYEDRTTRFFPHAPRVPRVPGLVSGDNNGLMDETDDSFWELFDSSHQQFNILCSGDNSGTICFSIFGIFQIGRVNVQNLACHSSLVGEQGPCKLMNASLYKVALSNDFCQMTALCSGVISQTKSEASANPAFGSDLQGLLCLTLDSSILRKRENELHQVAQQASNVEHLIEVIRRSLHVMSKQWSDAMHVFHEKFKVLTTLIADNGLMSTPQEEFYGLLGGARTSPAVHQFLVNSLGEAGIKRVAKVVCGAGKELQTIMLDHLQPAAEILVFRIGELRGLSKWRSCYRGIGLDEKLIDNATEKGGMLLIQIHRFIRILSSVVQQFSNFFNWLQKSVRVLMSEPSESVVPFSRFDYNLYSLILVKLSWLLVPSFSCSELVVVFLQFLYDQDPIRMLLEDKNVVGVDLEMGQRFIELAAHFGGFLDTQCLQRTLAQEFQLLESSLKEALEMPLCTVSRGLVCKSVLPLFPTSSAPNAEDSYVPTSVSHYEQASSHSAVDHMRLIDYTCFTVPDEISQNISNCIA